MRSLWAAAIVTVLTGPAWGAVWYVDVSNTSGNKDGLTWQTAFTSIQDGIDAAARAAGGEVWVADGVYQGSTGPVVNLAEGVEVYGGFAGHETTRAERNWTVNETVIDGEGRRRCIESESNAVLDGFTVTRGTAEQGAGLIVLAGTLRVEHCTFRDNTAVSPGQSAEGGAIQAIAGTLTIVDCQFFTNSAHLGGAVACGTGVTVAIEKCGFHQNTATGAGGAVLVEGEFILADSRFFFNGAAQGAGVYAGPTSNGNMANVLFARNDATQGGGAVCLRAGSQVEIVNGTFHMNTAGEQVPESTDPPLGRGGAIYDEMNNDQFRLVNSILWENSPDQVFHQLSFSPYMVHCDIQDATDLVDGNISEPPRFTNPDDLDYSLHPDSACIGTGTSTGVPSFDIDGVPRPRGIGVDMGAFEFNGGAIEGVVRDAETGDPITCAAVVLFGPFRFERRVATDLTGRYRAFDLPAGEFSVAIHSPRYTRALRPIDIEPGVTTVESFDLEPVSLLGGVQGTVLDADFLQPLVGIRVTAWVGDTTQAFTYTCADGRFAFTWDELVPSLSIKSLAKEDPAVVLEFSGPGYQTTDEFVALSSETTQESNVFMKSSAVGLGALAGLVTGATAVPGVPLQGARITALGGGSITAVSGNDGTYSLPAVRAGKFTLEFSAVGFQTEVRQTVVKALDIETLNVELQPDAGPIPEDIDRNGEVNAIDVQLCVNAVLGEDIAPYDADVDGSGQANAVDVQRVVNAVLGLTKTCRACGQ